MSCQIILLLLVLLLIILILYYYKNLIILITIVFSSSGSSIEKNVYFETHKYKIFKTSLFVFCCRGCVYFSTHRS